MKLQSGRSAKVPGLTLACGTVSHGGDRDICFDSECADITAATPVPALGRHISLHTAAGSMGEHKDPEYEMSLAVSSGPLL